MHAIKCQKARLSFSELMYEQINSYASKSFIIESFPKFNHSFFIEDPRRSDMKFCLIGSVDLLSNFTKVKYDFWT